MLRSVRVLQCNGFEVPMTVALAAIATGAELRLYVVADVPAGVAAGIGNGCTLPSPSLSRWFGFNSIGQAGRRSWVASARAGRASFSPLSRATSSRASSCA